MKYWFVLVFSTTFFLSSCGNGGGSSENPDPVVATGSQNITVRVAEVSGATLSSRAVLSFSGIDVLDAQDNSVSSLESSIGQLITEIKTTSLVDATDLKIMVKAEGYVDTGTTVQLSEDETEYEVSVLMVVDEAGKTGDGIFTFVQNDLTGISASGTTTSEISLNLEESSDTPSLSVTIPSGTQLTDDNGNPISAVSVSMVRFDPTQENVLDAYPGGLNVQADVGNGEMQQIDFKSAGFASIVMKDEDGQKVKNFSQDVEIAMQFRIGTTDGEGNVVQLGDTVPIWSYNEDEGTWIAEGQDGEVEDLDLTDGLYDVVYNADHLTYFNLDWKTDVCDAYFEIEDADNLLQNNTLKVDLKFNDYNVHQSFIYNGDGFIQLLSIPQSMDWVLEFRDPITDEIIDTITDNSSICGERVINVDLPSDPSTSTNLTEIEVGLYCGVNLQENADVFIVDENNVLINYSFTTGQSINLRTDNEGIVRIPDLPNNFIGKTLDVTLFSLNDSERLGIDNTPGPFPIILGESADVNNIVLQMPDEYCQAGGFSPTTITASLTCPGGLVPNTQLETIPFFGFATASLASDAISSVVANFNDEGNAVLSLLNNTEYNLSIDSSSPSINASITNPPFGEVIIGGESKTYDFLLNDDYCSRDVVDETFTFIDGNGSTITSVAINNPNGSIDLGDYFPTSSVESNYTTFYKNANSQEFQSSDVVNIEVIDNKITEVDGDAETEFTIEADKVRIISFVEDDDGNFQKVTDGAYGRFFDVGDQISQTDIEGISEFTFDVITTSIEYDLEQKCFIDETLTSFVQRGFSYSGDIIKIKCDSSGTITTSSSIDGIEVNSINQTNYLYLENGIGEIASTQDDCVPEDSFYANNSPGCTVNQYDYKFLVE